MKALNYNENLNTKKGIYEDDCLLECVPFSLV